MASVRILGPVELWDGERRLALGGPRQLTLFALLLLHANRAVSTDVLIDTLWGPARGGADNRLQMAIARLRKTLAEIDGDAGARLQTVARGYLLSIRPGELDADSFHAGVHAGAQALEAGDFARAAEVLDQALALWRGPPLPEVAFEDFAQGEIRRLEELRMRALECRIDAGLRLGRHAELIGELEGLLAEAPTREHVAGQLMLALYRSGRQADALDVFQRVRSALADELGLEPGPELTSLQIEILNQAAELGAPAGPTRPPALPAPSLDIRAPMPVRLRPYGPSVFAGRRKEREALARALNDVMASSRRAAFVTGEAGIGKTRLVSEFARDAHAQGMLVLGGRCDASLSLPYQPFVEALERLVAHAPTELLDRHVAEFGDSIARLVPALASHSVAPLGVTLEPSESERYVLFRAIEGLLALVSQSAPPLLVLEDLHWADLPTLELLTRLLTSPRSWRMMLLCTCRTDGLAGHHRLLELLADLHREPDTLRLTLTGLPRADIADLLRGIDDVPVGTADDDLVDRLEATTGGNPFFITELTRGLDEAGALETHDGRLSLTDGVDVTAHLPVSISETLDRRLARLPDDVRRCLGVAAVIGDVFDLKMLAEVAGGDWVAAAVQTGLDDALLLENPGRPASFRFAHALMQRYIYRALGRVRQSELHRKIALAMERRAERGVATFAELARHWLEAVGADVADAENAVRYSMLAGDDALLKLAPDDARQWYERALGLLEGNGVRGAERCELLIKRGEAERQAGDRRFRATLLEAAELAQHIGDKDKLVRAALANTRGMQSETGIVDWGRIAALDSALRIVGEQDSPERARLLAMQAAELMYSREWDRRVRLSDEAVAIARDLNDPGALSAVLNMRFVTLLAPETLVERQANSVESVAVAERLSDPLSRFYAYHWRAYACIEAGDVLGARSWTVREQDIADRFRQPTTVWLTRADQANLAIIAGKLDLADELSTAALEIGRQAEPDALACYAAQQTSVAFERGRLPELIPLLEAATKDNPGVPGFRATLALAFAEASRPEEARGLLGRSPAATFSELPYDVTWLAVTCIYAHVIAKLTDREAATVLYRMLEPWRGQIAFPAFGVWGPVDLYLGPLALVLGDVDAATRHLLEAARTAIRAGATIWETRATRRLAELQPLAEMAR